MKKAILAVSYGTTYPEALTASVEATENTFSSLFPDWEVRRAFTGKRIMEMLSKKGIYIDSLESALDKLAEEKYEKIILQPTHIINGSEYDKISDAAKVYKSRFAEIAVGAPLLSERSDIEALCHFFARTYSSSADAVLLMGHGSDHYANKLYSDFSDICKQLGYNNLYIATLEASPCLEDVIPVLKENVCHTVTVTPLLFVAGGHACKDMAGDEPGSWKSKLEADGFTVNAVVKGLGEYGEIRRLYADHLQALIRDKNFSERNTVIL